MLLTILGIVIMRFKFRALVIFFLSFLASWMAFKPILRVAKEKNIVDCPDVRKLQKTPIPVMGGIAVFFGIIVGLSFFKTMHAYTSLFPIICGMVMMLYVGSLDDILDIKPWKRFAVEILVALLLVFGTSYTMCNFQGMWGIDQLKPAVSIPLTVFAFIGIINAMNMIDGIDGLSSSFFILICSAFFFIFFFAHEFSFAALAIVCVGAVIPFFIHNVFGWNTKMFLGDGGSMMMGTIVATMVMAVLRNKFHFPLWPEFDFSRIAMVVAICSIPIADTLRVMTIRMIKGKSPFHADKTHLHHYLLMLGCSHIAITIIEISMNILVILTWFLSWRLGASLEWQLYFVIIVAAIFDFGTVAAIELLQKYSPDSFSRLCRRASQTSVQREGIWHGIQKIVDGKL